MSKMSDLCIVIQEEVEFGRWPEGPGVDSSDVAEVVRRVSEITGLNSGLVRPLVNQEIGRVLLNLEQEMWNRVVSS